MSVWIVVTVSLLVVSNLALWTMLRSLADVTQEWMDAMTECYDEHQHVRDYGRDTVQLSGPPLSTAYLSADSNSADGGRA